MEKMIRVLGRLANRLPFSQSMSAQLTVIRLLQLPVMGKLYYRFYAPVIARKASLRPNRVALETFNVCNLSCPMCPYPQMTRKKVQMDMNLSKKIIDDIAQNGIEWIEWFYFNEPLLDPVLFERLQYAKNKGLKIYLITNGTRLTQDKRNAILDSGLDLIGISLDAVTAETYQKIRNSDDFEKVRDNVLALIEERNRKSQNKPIIRIIFVVQKDNYHEVEMFKAFWRNHAVEIDIWELITKTPQMHELVVGKFDLAKLHLRYFYPCREAFYCPTILSDGRVTPCREDYNGLLTVGDFNTQTFKEIWDSPKYRKIRDIFLTGQGEKINICREIRCLYLYHHAYFKWWGRWV